MTKVNLFNDYTPEQKQAVDMLKKALQEEAKPKRPKYVITAGKNKIGRQMYMSTYIDSDTIEYTVVPCPMTKTKAMETLPRANKLLKEEQEKNYRKFPKDIKVEIKEWNETTQSILEN